MTNYFLRTIRLIFGLFLYALGISLSVQANVGLSPWDALSMGLSFLTNISFGNIVVITSFVIIIVDVLLREKIGFGTISNAILIGMFVSLIQGFNLIPQMSNFWLGVVMILAGQVVISLGSFFYIGSSLGCGPRDALMVALAKRIPNAPIGVIRGMIEGTVLVIGWLLGAKVGIGTIISVFGIGFILQFTFKVLQFDVKGVSHESIKETLKAS